MEDQSKEGARSDRRVRDWGFEEAAQAVERFIGLIDDRPQEQRQEAPGPEAASRSAFRQLRVDLARAVDANLDLVRRVLDLYAGAIERVLVDGSADFDERSRSHLRLPSAVPGGRSSSTVWIHNTTPWPGVALSPRGSDLTSTTGARVDASALSFEPVEIDLAPPGCSLPVTVTLEVDDEIAPGVYRGYIFVASLPDQFVIIELEVMNREDAGWVEQEPPAG